MTTSSAAAFRASKPAISDKRPHQCGNRKRDRFGYPRWKRKSMPQQEYPVSSLGAALDRKWTRPSTCKPQQKVGRSKGCPFPVLAPEPERLN